jgi:septal ring factor EnvC (AmiA/AmiB activator)
MRLFALRSLLFLAILNPLAIYADESDAAIEAKLRAALRDTTGQLSDAQGQLATAQSAQAQSDKDKADLQAKVDALTSQLKAVSDQAAADKASADKTIADIKQGSQTLFVHLIDTLTAQINNLAKPSDQSIAALHKNIEALKVQFPEFAADLDQFGADIQSWAVGYEEYVQLANRTETERAKLAVQTAQLQRTVDDRETKNLALYKLASEILTRYENFGLGDALLAKEPFIGVSRVKLQTLVQDYQNKLRDQVVVPGQQPAVVSSH